MGKKPKPCKKIIAQIKEYKWADDIFHEIKKLDKHIGKYKFKKAVSDLEDLMALIQDQA